MSDDLVKQARYAALSDMEHWRSVSLIEELADRIEELEAKLAKAVTFAEIVEKTGHGALWPLALDTLTELKRGRIGDE
jgi:hypothetical protein